MSDPQLLTRISGYISKGYSVALCILINKDGSGPRNLGAKMLITSEGETYGTIGGGGMERILIKEAKETITEGKPRTLHFAMGIPPREGMIPIDSKCGGEAKIFIDIIKPEPRLIIMGSGLIAQITAKYASDAGFEVIVVDDSKTATKENFPNAIVINGPLPDSLERVTIRHSDYVAILHGETPFELAALRKAVKSNPAYLGLLGSANKAAKHKEQFTKEGFDQRTIENIHGPIGLKINAETPEEIAISIAAELIETRRS